MVRAILDGHKTVTRRVVKPQPLWIEQDKKYRTCPSGWWWGLDRIKAIEDSQLFAQMLAAECAPCRSGDILYVRETWARTDCFGCTCRDCDTYIDRNGLTIFCNDATYVYRASDSVNGTIKWRPSIHMPREAARIFLRVTDVRVERLQDIEEDGAQAEGLCVGWSSTPKSSKSCSARQAFMWLWDSTIKPADREKYGWAANPWVWVIEFERCNKPEEG